MPPLDIRSVTEFIQLIRLQIPFTGFIKVTYQDTERYLYVKMKLWGRETILPIDKSNKTREWFKSTDSERILHIINALKYNDDSVDLKRIFTDFPAGSGGFHLMGNVPIGDSIIPIYMNFGLYSNTPTVLFNSPQIGGSYKYFDIPVYINGIEKKGAWANWEFGAKTKEEYVRKRKAILWIQMKPMHENFLQNYMYEQK